MKKRTLIAILGLWIALVPFLGVPSSWRSQIIIVSGLVVAALAFTRKKPTASTVESYEAPIAPKPVAPKIEAPKPQPVPRKVTPPVVESVAPVEHHVVNEKPAVEAVKNEAMPKIEEPAPAVMFAPEPLPKKPRRPRTIKLATQSSTASDVLPEAAPEELAVPEKAQEKPIQSSVKMTKMSKTAKV